MAPRTEYVAVNPDGPCPCRSGMITAACCMAPDGAFKVRFASPLPPGEPTGFAHPDCYMRDTNNCSKDTATGRYISGGVGDMLRTQAVCVHLPRGTAGKKPVVDIANLPAGIVCSRHNDALESLDNVALQAFGNILNAMAYVGMKSLATRNALYAASGEGLELWVLKLLFGACHATRAAGGETESKNTLPPDFNIFRKALATGALAAPCGLYIRKAATEQLREAGSTNKTDRFGSLRFDIGSLACELIVDPSGVVFDAIRNENFYRPSGIDMAGKRRSAHVHLSGPAFAMNESARFTLEETRGA